VTPAGFDWNAFVLAAMLRDPHACGPGPTANVMRVLTGEGPKGPDGAPLFADSYVDLDLASWEGGVIDATAHVL